MKRALSLLLALLLFPAAVFAPDAGSNEVITGQWTFEHGTKGPTGGIDRADGVRVPADATSGYAPGCIFTLRNATLGQCPTWLNQGTQTSSKFRPFGPVIGYGFAYAGDKLFVSGTAGLVCGYPVADSADIGFCGHSTSDDNDQIVSVKASTVGITCTNGADPLSAHSAYYAGLRSGCVPQYDIFAAGTKTLAGGNAAEAITITGALATDIPLVNYGATDDTDTISKAIMTANTLTVTMSADPSTTHSIHYAILRPRGSFKPTHYVAYAGTSTTVGGAAAEAITITGAKVGDIPIVRYAVTNDTDSILKSVVTANTLTVTMSADPSTAHALSYALLRAYP